ncbi:unnamed protein product [Cunninghamella echinulata]
MHHILNEYRPHQARETLRLLMEEQLERKKKQTAEIQQKTQETMDMLKAFGQNIPTLLSQQTKITEKDN